MSLTPQKILTALKESETALSKRDLARLLKVKAAQRVALKQILRQLEKEGAIIKQGGGVFSLPTGLPNVCMVEINNITIDGDVFGVPTDWPVESGEAPRIEIMPDGKPGEGMKQSDRALVRIKKTKDGHYTGKVIRRLDDPRGQVIGLVILQKKGFILKPTDKKAKHDFDLAQADLNGAKEGDLVIGELQPSRGLSRKKVRVIEIIGREDDPRAISLIALNERGLQIKFPEAVEAETKNMKVPELGKREDLRKIPLVTIDGADARDFDDAVFAEQLDDGTWHLIVAIADVSHYVRQNTALGREAYRRGNSTYFPDRVVPMLPEALSNDLCSLRPKEPRACVGFHIHIDGEGHLIKYKVFRGLMKSAARLTYEQVQAAYDGKTDDTTDTLLDAVIKPLYAVFKILDTARQKRGALDLDLPERQIMINEQGQMTGVQKRMRLDAHKLIEEFMVLANVAAAKALEDKNAPCIYRIHDRPSGEKVKALSDFLKSMDIPFPATGVVKPAQINHILQKSRNHEYSHVVSTVVLRSQSQAVYHADNIGHFGLALDRYAHFTSPIRRYADLIVHRSLIKAYGLGDGGIDDGEIAEIDEIAQHISTTERTSIEAERAAVDRFTAAYLSQHIGTIFSGKVSGVTNFGMFITLDDTGADGLVPIRTLPSDYYIHDEKTHSLRGRRNGLTFRLGQGVQVAIKEADGLTGSSLFEIVNHAPVKDMGRSSRKPLHKDKKPFKKKGKNTYKKRR